jgi:hypothetical protein
VSKGGSILSPHFDPTRLTDNISELPCDDTCVQKSLIRGFTLSNSKRESITVSFSEPDEYPIALFCFWLRCLGRDHIVVNNKPDLMVFLAEQFESEALRHIVTFIFFKSRVDDILITPIGIEA